MRGSAHDEPDPDADSELTPSTETNDGSIVQDAANLCKLFNGNKFKELVDNLNDIDILKKRIDDVKCALDMKTRIGKRKLNESGQTSEGLIILESELRDDETKLEKLYNELNEQKTQLNAKNAGIHFLCICPKDEIGHGVLAVGAEKTNSMSVGEEVVSHVLDSKTPTTSDYQPPAKMSRISPELTVMNHTDIEKQMALGKGELYPDLTFPSW